jgi:hypothetical protein
MPTISCLDIYIAAAAAAAAAAVATVVSTVQGPYLVVGLERDGVQAAQWQLLTASVGSSLTQRARQHRRVVAHKPAGTSVSRREEAR